VYRGAVTGFSTVFVLIGLLVLVVTLANGGGPLSVGFLMGIAFIVVGAGRLYVNSRMGK
jgi:dipeptide/tripeptide permease